jgi:hypothetical protein
MKGGSTRRPYMDAQAVLQTAAISTVLPASDVTRTRYYVGHEEAAGASRGRARGDLRSLTVRPTRARPKPPPLGRWTAMHRGAIAETAEPKRGGDL